VKNFRQHQHRPKKSTLVIGANAVIDALGSGKQLERIYLQNNYPTDTGDKLRKMAADHGVPVNKVPVEKINGFNIGDHDGCVAVIARIQYQDLQQVISFTFDRGRTPLFIILDGITDIRNIGGIARTAFCCGVQAIIIPEKGVGSLNEDAILTSAGALEKLAICRTPALTQAADLLHLNGIKVFASDMNAEESLLAVDFTEPCAIVLGSEEKGITPALVKQCDISFSIPMKGNFDSFNVSVAAGIILFESMKQRKFA